MSRKRGDPVIAGFFGAFGLILTYLVTHLLTVPGDFLIALGVGVGIMLLTFLFLFVRGLREAKQLDRWESEHPAPYLARYTVRMLSASEVWRGNLYLYPDRLIMVSPRKKQELTIRREEIKEIMAGAEDTELITDEKGIYSLDCGEESQETEAIKAWYDNKN